MLLGMRFTLNVQRSRVCKQGSQLQSVGFFGFSSFFCNDVIVNSEYRVVQKSVY